LCSWYSKPMSSSFIIASQSHSKLITSHWDTVCAEEIEVVEQKCLVVNDTVEIVDDEDYEVSSYLIYQDIVSRDVADKDLIMVVKLSSIRPPTSVDDMMAKMISYECYDHKQKKDMIFNAKFMFENSSFMRTAKWHKIYGIQEQLGVISSRIFMLPKESVLIGVLGDYWAVGRGEKGWVLSDDEQQIKLGGVPSCFLSHSMVRTIILREVKTSDMLYFRGRKGAYECSPWNLKVDPNKRALTPSFASTYKSQRFIDFASYQSDFDQVFWMHVIGTHISYQVNTKKATLQVLDSNSGYQQDGVDFEEDFVYDDENF